MCTAYRPCLLTQDINPLLEDALNDHGGKYSKGDDWGVYAIADGKLITGQVRISSRLQCNAQCCVAHAAPS